MDVLDLFRKVVRKSNISSVQVFIKGLNEFLVLVVAESSNHWSWTIRWSLTLRLFRNAVHSFEADTFYLFERNLHFRYKQISHHNFGVFIDFFLNIKDSYIFTSRIGLQLNISSFECFDVRIKRFIVLDVFKRV